MLNRLARSPGESQRELAGALAMHAPRLVALIDDLKARGLVKRRRDTRGRRNYSISLTAAGRQTTRRIAAVARQHEQALTAALDEHERAQLASLLERIARQQALAPGVHPGFRRLGRRRRERSLNGQFSSACLSVLSFRVRRAAGWLRLRRALLRLPN